MNYDIFRKTAQHKVTKGLSSYPDDRPVIGFDLSLKSTGVCILWGDRMSVFRFNEIGSGATRLAQYRAQIGDILRRYSPSSIGIEDYSFGSKGKTYQIGELGGVARVCCHDAGIRTVLIPPTTMKKFIAGSGKALKPAVRTCLNERFGVLITQRDEADAAGIALFTADYYYGCASHTDTVKGATTVREME